MSIALDPQLAGVADDGTPEGVVRTKLVRGELVRVPFKVSGFVSESSGGAGATFATSPLAIHPNLDASGTSMTLTTLADSSLSGGGVMLWFPFRGRVFGVRWRRDLSSSSYPPRFSVMIDGVSYGVTTGDTRWTVEAHTSIVEEAQQIIADDLSEGMHHAQLVLTGGAVAYSLVVHGILVESRAGYRPPLPMAVPLTRAVSGAAALAVSPGAAIYSFSGTGAYPAFRRVDYMNTSASPVTVTIADGSGGNPIWQAVLAAAGSAGSTASFDPGCWVRAAALFHYASTGGVVNATPWVGVVNA